MSEAELARPSVNQSIPSSKKQLREQIAADTEAFLAAGGTIKTDYSRLSDGALIGQDKVCQLLCTDGVAVASAIRNGALFGKPFPKPLRYRNKSPVWRAGDIFAFYRSL